MNWERLESATIDPQLDEGLEARIGDAAWLLARQWQAGEFRGEDAANPVLIQIEARSVQVDRVVTANDGSVAALHPGTPLEPVVEREAIRAGPGGHRVAADLGLILLTALARLPATGAVQQRLRDRYRLALPADDGLDPVGRRRLELLARRSLDGVALASDLDADPALLNRLLENLDVADDPRRQIIDVVRTWATETSAAFQEPAATTAWNPTRMEYRFDLRASEEQGDIRLVADGYAGGRLDWHHFDRADTANATAPPSKVTARSAEVLPVHLRFHGMPALRFWTFEHGDVSFGAIDVGPEDLARVAVAGYATMYGDDWYVVPVQVRAATLTTITSLRVLDDFGGRTLVPAAAVVDGGGDDRAFRFFELTGDPGPPAGMAPALFLPPSVETTDAGKPLEDVRFVRDEVANLAWAIEHRIESVAGRPVDLAARTPASGSTAEHPDDGRLPRRHRAEHTQPASGSHGARTDRLDGVGDSARMHRQRTGQRVELHQQPGEHRPDRLGVAGERAQPTPHRRDRPPQPTGDRAMPGTGGLRPQRRTDHIDPIGPPQQTRHRQQHMRHQAGTTPGTTRSKITNPADRPPPGMPPPSQTTAARTNKLTSTKTPFDLDRVAAYHDHGCLQQHQGTALPSGQGIGRAVARPERDQTVVAHEQRATRRQPL
jgi:hypothetical protein